MSGNGLYVNRLIGQYRSRGALIDTNLMVLLIVGYYNVQRISRFKRTVSYTISDFNLVSELAARFERRLTSPNILTEVDNLCRQLPISEHAGIAESARVIVGRLVEVYQQSLDVVARDDYRTFGITDAVTIAIALNHLVLTDDLRLASFLSAQGRDVININHLRF